MFVSKYFSDQFQLHSETFYICITIRFFVSDELRWFFRDISKKFLYTLLELNTKFLTFIFCFD
jgi:hypothetical protein